MICEREVLVMRTSGLPKRHFAQYAAQPMHAAVWRKKALWEPSNNARATRRGERGPVLEARAPVWLSHDTTAPHGVEKKGRGTCFYGRGRSTGRSPAPRPRSR